MRIITILIFVFIFQSCSNNKHESNKKISFDKEYKNFSNIRKLTYLDSISEKLISKHNDTVLRNLYLKLATEYYYLNNQKKSFRICQKSLQLSKEVNDSSRMAKSYYYLGDCFENTKRDSAYYYYNLAEKIYNNINDFENEGRMFFNKSFVLFYNGNYLECEVMATKALKKIELSTNYELIYANYNLLGNCQEKLSRYDDALRYHKLAQKVLKKININKKDIKNFKISSLINVCNLYDKKKEHFKAIKILDSLLNNDLKKENPRIYSNVLGNLAYSKMKSGNLKNVEDMLLKSLKISDSINISSDILNKKMNLFDYYLLAKDTTTAIKYLKESNILATKIKSSNEVLITLKMLSMIDKNKLYYFEKYFNYNDSLNVIQKKTYDKFTRIEYETNKIELENQSLTLKVFYTILISTCLVVILLVTIFLRYIVNKNMELKLIYEKNNANNEIYHLISVQQEKINSITKNEKNRIAKELHDGIMNKIYSIRMNLGFFNSKIDAVSIEKRKIYIHELQNVENEIRIISHNLNANSLFEKTTFILLIKNLIDNQRSISKTEFILSLDYDMDFESLQNIYKINIYRIIQEALLNVIKYSNANTCEVTLKMTSKNMLKVKIADDGIGFNNLKNNPGIGIKNIKERAKIINGELTINSEINKGTEIIVLIKLTSN